MPRQPDLTLVQHPAPPLPGCNGLHLSRAPRLGGWAVAPSQFSTAAHESASNSKGNCSALRDLSFEAENAQPNGCTDTPPKGINVNPGFAKSRLTNNNVEYCAFR